MKCLTFLNRLAEYCHSYNRLNIPSTTTYTPLLLVFALQLKSLTSLLLKLGFGAPSPLRRSGATIAEL
jgi:hypothetical protein